MGIVRKKSLFLYNFSMDEMAVANKNVASTETTPGFSQTLAPAQFAKKVLVSISAPADKHKAAVLITVSPAPLTSEIMIGREGV